MARIISRRTLFVELAGTAAAVALLEGGASARSQTKIPIAVYKSPTCTCCQVWVDHMAANGFAPTVTPMQTMTPIKTKYRIAAELQSCHTSLVGGYVIEGHVPAADVKKLLAAKPAGIVGLTIPGMPQSAPGMDLTPFQPFTVLTFDEKGVTKEFARHVKPGA